MASLLIDGARDRHLLETPQGLPLESALSYLEGRNHRIGKVGKDC